MVIRVMTFEGCPNCEATRVLVEDTVKELRVQADIEAIQVGNEDEARRYGFLGSPTIQVDGKDIEASRQSEQASFSCRVYRTPNGISGVPPKILLLNAIRAAQLNPK
jgi:thiol-disulfide isomerase/thioredoxin